MKIFPAAGRVRQRMRVGCPLPAAVDCPLPAAVDYPLEAVDYPLEVTTLYWEGYVYLEAVLWVFPPWA